MLVRGSTPNSSQHEAGEDREGMNPEGLLLPATGCGSERSGLREPVALTHSRLEMLPVRQAGHSATHRGTLAPCQAERGEAQPSPAPPEAARRRVSSAL